MKIHTLSGALKNHLYWQFCCFVTGQQRMKVAPGHGAVFTPTWKWCHANVWLWFHLHLSSLVGPAWTWWLFLHIYMWHNLHENRKEKGKGMYDHIFYKALVNRYRYWWKKWYWKAKTLKNIVILRDFIKEKKFCSKPMKTKLYNLGVWTGPWWLDGLWIYCLNLL